MFIIVIFSTLILFLISNASATSTGLGAVFWENEILSKAFPQNMTDCLRSTYGMNSLAPQSFYITHQSNMFGEYYSANFDDTICSSMNSARASNMETRSLSLIACPICKNVNNNLNDQLKTLTNYLVRDCTSYSYNGITWIELLNQYWDTSNVENNKKILSNLVDACVSSMDIKCGILSSVSNWNAIIGYNSTYNYPASKGLPLMYAALDGVPNFDSYAEQSFGGWAAPAAKEYGALGVVDNTCGGPESLYLSYSPAW